MRLLNKHGEARPFVLTVKGDPAIRLSLEGIEGDTLVVPADDTTNQRVYLEAPAGSQAAQSARTDVRLWVEDTANGERASKGTVFNGKAE
ncbi:FixG Ig-like domain-containing protein [Roseovarius pelagicus]|uniref:FixG Ig-like domain-containing protein n=1 Tax=Roseovarius pelagicus TaxID=2980108 RepID=UPI0035717643